MTDIIIVMADIRKDTLTRRLPMNNFQYECNYTYLMHDVIACHRRHRSGGSVALRADDHSAVPHEPPARKARRGQLRARSAGVRTEAAAAEQRAGSARRRDTQRRERCHVERRSRVASRLHSQHVSRERHAQPEGGVLASAGPSRAARLHYVRRPHSHCARVLRVTQRSLMSDGRVFISRSVVYIYSSLIITQDLISNSK